MTDLKELLPCPFCGTEMVLRNGEYFHHAYEQPVDACVLSGWGFPATTRHGIDQIAAWNTRAGDLIPRAQAEAEKRAEVVAVLDNPTEEDCANAALSFDHAFGLLSQDERRLEALKAKWWLQAWANTIRARYQKEEEG